MKIARSLALLGVATLACEPRTRPAIGVAIWLPDSGTVIQVLHRTLAEAFPDITLLTGADLIGVGGWPGGGEEVERAARFAAYPGIAGVVGHPSSRGSLLAAPIYAAAGVPLVVPTGTSRRLREAGPWVLRLAPDDSTEAAFLVAFAADSLGARSLTTFFDNDEYGVGLRDAVRAEAARWDITVVADLPVTGICSGRRDASVALGVPATDPPDVVVIAARTPDAVCLAQRVHARSPRTPFVAGDGVEIDATLHEVVRTAALEFYTVAFWHVGVRGPPSQDFVRRFRSTLGRDPAPGDALAYDAVLMLASAIAERGGRGRAVRDYLQSLGASRPPYEGVTGPIAFAAPRRPIYMLRVRSDAVVPVATWP